MELTPFTIYLIMQADSLVSGLFGFAFIFMAVGIGVAIIMIPISVEVAEPNEETAWYVRWSKRITLPLIGTALVFGLASVVLPSTKTLIAMYGIPTAIQAADAVQLDETAKKSVAAVNKLLDEYLSEKK